MKHLHAIILFVFAAISMTLHADDRLFYVSKNLNNNIVCYDVQRNGDGLNVSEPMKVYWYKAETNNSWELNTIQRKLAYGYNVEKASKSEARITLKACPKRYLYVRRVGGKWVAITNINGKECILTEIFAFCKSSIKCEYIELRGKTLSDNSRQTEKIKN